MDVIWSVLDGLGFESTTFFVQIALFFLLHFSMGFLIYNPIMEIRDKRDARLAMNLNAAEVAAAEARRLKEEYEQRVRVARVESQMALSQATEAAEAEGKVRVERAREEASRIMSEARAEARVARDRAFADAKDRSERVAEVMVGRLFAASLGEPRGREVSAELVGGSKS